MDWGNFYVNMEADYVYNGELIGNNDLIDLRALGIEPHTPVLPRSSPLFLPIAIFVHWQVARKGLLNRISSQPHRSSNFDFLISLRFCYAPNGHIVFERIRSGCQVCRRSAKRMVQNSLGPLHWTQLSFTRPWSISCMDLLGPFALDHSEEP